MISLVLPEMRASAALLVECYTDVEEVHCPFGDYAMALLV